MSPKITVPRSPISGPLGHASAPSITSGERRRQGSITKAGNTHARRAFALVEGAWASRYPAKVSRHLQLRLEK
jgi:transposase